MFSAHARIDFSLRFSPFFMLQIVISIVRFCHRYHFMSTVVALHHMYKMPSTQQVTEPSLFIWVDTSALGPHLRGNHNTYLRLTGWLSTFHLALHIPLHAMATRQGAPISLLLNDSGLIELGVAPSIAFIIDQVKLSSDFM
jgi:hypothetical protein